MAVQVVEAPIAHLMYSLPTAIHQAGVNLLHLDLRIEIRSFSHAWTLDDNSRRLSALGENLRLFAYHGTVDTSGDELTHCLRLLISGQNLISLELGFPLTTPPRYSFVRDL